MLFILLLLLPGLKTEETTLSNLFSPKTFKTLPFDAVKFLKQTKPTKKGPVLFPNDGPTPPPTPLIVTSRPLIESIRRSELNPNNTVQASSQLNQVMFRPDYPGTSVSSTPTSYLPTSATLYDFVRIPYDETPIAQLSGRKAVDDYVRGSSHRPVIYRGISDNVNRILDDSKKPVLPRLTYPDYEYKDTSTDYTNIYRNHHTNDDSNTFHLQQRPVLPPIYRTFSNHAQNILNQQKYPALHEKPVHQYQDSSPEYNNYNNGDDNYGENYAFSYTVKDHKTGDDFSHSQSSSGAATNGEYRVRLPDGRMQIVSYTADERGYKADVRYDEFDDAGNKNDYSNNHFELNNSKGVNYNNKANSYEDLNEGNFHVYRTDKNKITDTLNRNKQPSGLLNINNNYKIFQNDKVTYDNDINDDIYNEKISQPNVGDYDHYEDVDYSVDKTNYQPYKSKYSLYRESDNQVNKNAVKSTVIPPYEELKNLFVTQNPVFRVADPQESEAERVVVVGTKKPDLVTNIKKLITDASVSPSPTYHGSTAAPPVTTPGGYLYSTITNLKNKLNLSVKPILSQEYLNKINKYLDLKN